MNLDNYRCLNEITLGSQNFRFLRFNALLFRQYFNLNLCFCNTSNNESLSVSNKLYYNSNITVNLYRTSPEIHRGGRDTCNFPYKFAK